MAYLRYEKLYKSILEVPSYPYCRPVDYIAMRAYYFDNIPGDQRLPHDSGTPVSDHILKSLGLLHWYIPTSEQNQVDTIAEERDHKNKDTMNVTKQGLGDLFEEKLKSYYQEYALLSQYRVSIRQQLM
jgi:hypothetical protein